MDMNMMKNSMLGLVYASLCAAVFTIYVSPKDLENPLFVLFLMFGLFVGCYLIGFVQGTEFIEYKIDQEKGI